MSDEVCSILSTTKINDNIQTQKILCDEDHDSLKIFKLRPEFRFPSLSLDLDLDLDFNDNLNFANSPDILDQDEEAIINFCSSPSGPLYNLSKQITQLTRDSSQVSEEISEVNSQINLYRVESIELGELFHVEDVHGKQIKKQKKQHIIGLVGRSPSCHILKLNNSKAGGVIPFCGNYKIGEDQRWGFGSISITKKVINFAQNKFSLEEEGWKYGLDNRGLVFLLLILKDVENIQTEIIEASLHSLKFLCENQVLATTFADQMDGLFILLDILLKCIHSNYFTYVNNNGTCINGNTFTCSNIGACMTRDNITQANSTKNSSTLYEYNNLYNGDSIVGGSNDITSSLVIAINCIVLKACLNKIQKNQSKQILRGLRKSFFSSQIQRNVWQQFGSLYEDEIFMKAQILLQQDLKSSKVDIYEGVFPLAWNSTT